MLKEGYRHYAGLEEAILRNIDACKEISNVTRTSFGPNGMKKMVVNHIDKIFVTNDASTMLREVEIQHPAVKLIAMAAKMQKEDFGDATNYVVTLAGELLSQAELLIKTGLHPSAIITGYEIALAEAVRHLEASVALTVSSPADEEKVRQVIESTLAPKLPNHYQFFSGLVAKACTDILQDTTPRFNADNVRVVKVLGGSLTDSTLIQGYVIVRAPEGDFRSQVKNAKVAAYSCPFDPQGGETKGTVLITKADDLIKYNATEEELSEKYVKAIAETGVNVVVVGGSISELCLHYLNKYNLFVLKVQSKFELARLCKSLNAVPIPKLGAPVPEEIGYADLVDVREVGSTRVTVFERSAGKNGKLVTILLRGAIMSMMDDVERALENGVSAYKQLLHDPRFVYGASAMECFLLNKLESHSGTLTGLEQYSCARFGQAFEIFPRMLLENAGLNSNELLPNIIGQNVDGPLQGVDVFKGRIAPSTDLEVYDNLLSKINAMKLAAHATLTILRIDQIIIAKPAGGPKPRDNKGWDND